MQYEPSSSLRSSSPFNPNTLSVPTLASTSSSPGPSSSSPSQLSHRQTSYKSRQSIRKIPNGSGARLHDRFLDRCLSRIKSDRSAALTAARGSAYANTVYAKEEGSGQWSAEEELVMRKMIRREWEMFKRDYSDDWVDEVGEVLPEDDVEDVMQPPEEEELEYFIRQAMDQQSNDVEMDDSSTLRPSFAQLVGNASCLVCQAPASALCQTDTAIACLACHWSLTLSSLSSAQEVFYRHGFVLVMHLARNADSRPIVYLRTIHRCSIMMQLLALAAYVQAVRR